MGCMLYPATWLIPDVGRVILLSGEIRAGVASTEWGVKVGEIR